jgi:8-amino-7-oxononanoate synthase
MRGAQRVGLTPRRPPAETPFRNLWSQMSRFDALFQTELDRLAATGLRRTLTEFAPARPGHAALGGRELLNVSSNDYLGLSRHPALAERAAEYARAYGTGAGASRLVTGTTPAHAAIDRKLAGLKGKSAAMLLASGWQANAAVLGALLRAAGPDTKLFSDELNHNSLVQGARLAGIKPIRFPHNDMDDLARCLAEARDQPGRRFIVSETVFSMDGDRADLDALRRLAEAHDAFLYLDEAHATGVLGAGGMGLCAHVPGIDLTMGTFSKAMGSFGAYVAGSEALIAYLQNACAGFVYTTALPPPVLGAIDAALDLVPGMDAERAHLAALAAALRGALGRLGIETGGSSTQIVPAMVGEAGEAVDLAGRLRAAGVLAVAIRPPTVPNGSSRLRFALSAVHGEADLARLIAAIRAAWPRRRLAA